MILLIIIGIVALLFGILLLLSPDTLKGLETKFNKALIVSEEKIYDIRIGVGVSSILVSILTFFIAYYLIKTY